MLKKENKNKKEKKENFSLGWKRFILELKKRKKQTVILFLFVVFSYAVHTFGPFLIGRIIDSLIHGGADKTFLFWSLSPVYFYLIFLGLKMITESVGYIFLFNYFTSKMSNSIYREYTYKVFSDLISYPVGFFKENSLGKLTYSVNTGAKTLSNSFRNITDMLGFPMLILLNTFFLFFISWQAGILILTTNILFIFYFYHTKEKRKKVAKEYNLAKKDINNIVTENINLSLEIKKSSNEEYEKRKLQNNFDSNYENKFKNKLHFDIINSAFLDILYFISFILFYILIIYLYKNGMITEGFIVSAIMYAAAVNRNIGWFIKSLNGYVDDFTVIGDTEKLLLHESENYFEEKKTRNIDGEIEYKSVGFEYDFEPKNVEHFSADDTKNNLEKKEIGKKKKFSLTNISLKIEKGQKVAFVGESGGGKSTAVELVGGFYFPNKGEILVDSISTKDWNLHDLRSSIAYVSQDIAIFNSTIGENISYGSVSNTSKDEIKKAAKLANIDKFIENLPEEYKTKVGEKGLKLSGGQKQRIAIARAILRNPKILILDEPTSALDIVSEKYITESLKTLMKNRTTIIIAHRLSTVADADKIFVFKDGQVVEEGNYKELVSQNGEFKRMVDLHEQLS